MFARRQSAAKGYKTEKKDKSQGGQPKAPARPWPCCWGGDGVMVGGGFNIYIHIYINFILYCVQAVLTFSCLQENRVGHDIFNLHCQNASPEQPRYISLSGKRRFFWSNVPTTVRLLDAHTANAALAHSRSLMVAFVLSSARCLSFF